MPFLLAQRAVESVLAAWYKKSTDLMLALCCQTYCKDTVFWSPMHQLLSQAATSFTGSTSGSLRVQEPAWNDNLPVESES